MLSRLKRLFCRIFICVSLGYFSRRAVRLSLTRLPVPYVAHVRHSRRNKDGIADRHRCARACPLILGRHARKPLARERGEKARQQLGRKSAGAPCEAGGAGRGGAGRVTGEGGRHAVVVRRMNEKVGPKKTSVTTLKRIFR